LKPQAKYEDDGRGHALESNLKLLTVLETMAQDLKKQSEITIVTPSDLFIVLSGNQKPTFPLQGGVTHLKLIENVSVIILTTSCKTDFII